MRPFKFVEAESVAQACHLLETGLGSTRLIAGGTDLMGEIKEGVVGPSTLISILNLSELQGVEAESEGLRIGALTTLAQLEDHPEIAKAFPALHQAVSSVATPQIRNVGTIGGNLCQRPRCWYYRSSLFDCRKKGGPTCFAITGNNKYHAIFGGMDCFIVHPSDLAVALISLRAEAIIAGPDGYRTLPLEEFFVAPDHNILAETVLQPGEILTLVTVPRASQHHRSAYLKARERQTQDFALASVAIAMELSDGVVHDVRITLGGVAPIPLQVPHAEDAVRGRSVEEIDPESVAQLAMRHARPLRDNRYKVPLTASLIARGVRSLVESDGSCD
ncbi:MAG: FAD binding domain-containing protein [Dehalococcoidia bacterium]